MRETLKFIPLLILCLLISCGGGARSGSDTALSQPPVARADVIADAGAWADSVMERISLRAQIGQLFLPAIYAADDPATVAAAVAYVRDNCIGGLVLLKGTPRGARLIADTTSCVADVAPFIAIDAEWGLGMRLEGAAVYPLNKSLARTSRECDFYDYGREVAAQCRELGINMVLGPVLDVAPDSKSIMASRSIGADPMLVAAFGVAYARGLESGGVISVAKHFPGHGSPSTDTHKSLVVITKSLNELRECDLVPFREYADQELSAIMVGHLALPAVDPDMLPAAASEVVMRDLLRDELEFRGLVITDALNMGGAKGVTALEAIRAGADMVMAPDDTYSEISEIEDSVASGNLDPAIIRDRCRRILISKYVHHILSEKAGARDGK